MFSDEEIRTAMGGLVKQKGENHTSFGRYADPMTGQGACFLGALCQFMGKAIPAEGVSAHRVLGKGAVSHQMETAFTVAMNLNDSQYEWKYILVAVDKVLALPPIPKDEIGCPCGCTGNMTLSKVMDEIRAMRALDLQRLGRRVASMASGGIITGIQSFSSAMTSLGKITISFPTSTLGEYSYVSPTPAAVVASKQDHALVA